MPKCDFCEIPLRPASALTVESPNWRLIIDEGPSGRIVREYGSIACMLIDTLRQVDAPASLKRAAIKAIENMMEPAAKSPKMPLDDES